MQKILEIENVKIDALNELIASTTRNQKATATEILKLLLGSAKLNKSSLPRPFSGGGITTQPVASYKNQLSKG